jgi:hypothetical protein
VYLAAVLHQQTERLQLLVKVFVPSQGHLLLMRQQQTKHQQVLAVVLSYKHRQGRNL